jgi:transcriptional regulator with XRE-family HTH domain
MAVRYDDIGNRLKAFRLASGLSAEEIASRVGISRTAFYRFEKGELAKIETLEKLATLLNVSITTLLGVGTEYVASAVSYFERIRQIEEQVEHIFILAGPCSFLLTSDKFDETLEAAVRETVPDDCEDGVRSHEEASRIMSILRQRKETYRQRRPSIVTLISSVEIDRFVQNGLVGRRTLSEALRRERRALARAEVARLAGLIEEEPIGVQIGIFHEAPPHTEFQLYRQPDRQILAESPFRLGEYPNVRNGVGMITSAPEALCLHEKTVGEMWKWALKGKPAATFLRNVVEQSREDVLPANVTSVQSRRKVR